MSIKTLGLPLALAAGFAAGPARAQGAACSGMGLGPGASLNGFVPFPAGDLWNLDISAAPLAPNSAAIIAFIGANAPLHPDFGGAMYQGHAIGIPYQVVDSAQGLVDVKFTAYADESDPGPMPVPKKALVEGYPKPKGDRHLLVLDRDGCWLYELYGASPGKKGKWKADSAAIWDMTASPARPFTWTSADAAGLPVFPGLARADEAAAGLIAHALRFTVPVSRQAYTPPATHWASSNTNPDAPPMGARLRLKAAFDISGFPPQAKAILQALKTYGMILADNGSAFYVSGAPGPGWDDSDLNMLKTLHGSDFEVVAMDTVITPGSVPSGAAPAILSFDAMPAPSSAGSPVTLDWAVTGATYVIVSPSVGPVRGTSALVSPKKTTTYELTATNEFGRTTATVTVTVH